MAGPRNDQHDHWPHAAAGYEALAPLPRFGFCSSRSGPDEHKIDLFVHYDHTRIFTFGALIAGLLLFWIDSLFLRTLDTAKPPIDWSLALARGPWLFVAVYLLLMLVRVRWLNVAVLAAGLLFYSWEIAWVPLNS